jgi:hypothetical protein
MPKKAKPKNRKKTAKLKAKFKRKFKKARTRQADGVKARRFS